MSFSFSKEHLEPNILKQSLSKNSAAGAYVIFEGKVRNHNHNRLVRTLEYEAYEELALLEARKIISECQNKFDILEAMAVHRLGFLVVDDCAIWIAVTAAHRDDAFRACRYIIDEIKQRVPIWKKETYIDGSSGWINCSAHENNGTAITKQVYYEKQIRLFGEAKQASLQKSKVLVIGAGGLGCPALIYLASAGVGTIGICDFDIVDQSNLSRQILYNVNTIGLSKAESAAQKLSDLNPFIEAIIYDEALNKDNACRLFEPYDLILDCTDNLASKIIINDMATVMRKAFIQASIYQYEGQIHGCFPGHLENGYRTHSGQCLRCLWSKEVIALGSSDCRETGVLGASAGIIGAMQAMEAVKYLTGLPSSLKDSFVLFDLLTLETQIIKTIRKPDCSICGDDSKNVIAKTFSK